MKIIVDNLAGTEIHALLREHLRGMAENSPPESIHALDLHGLRQPEITFWTAWDGHDLLGCGAIKQLDTGHAEVKSMRTAAQHLRKGVAKALLVHILAEAKRRGYTRLSLETGSAAAFIPAQSLYRNLGFEFCGPFGDYVKDDFSVFMTRAL